MGFGYSSLTIASHSVLILILIGVATRALRAMDGRLLGAAMQHGLPGGIAMLAFGLMIERSYYLAARVLRPVGADLWQMHPAPEVLSTLTAASLYYSMVPLILAAHPTRTKAMERIGSEVFGLMVLWGVIVAALY